jgi:hypothetical protein
LSDTSKKKGKGKHHNSIFSVTAETPVVVNNNDAKKERGNTKGAEVHTLLHSS